MSRYYIYRPPFKEPTLTELIENCKPYRVDQYHKNYHAFKERLYRERKKAVAQILALQNKDA